ncbi:MAG: hypothetical protein P4M14_12315 [Gammaproteobacteria bacterium]|nr:hypothetical protein [Gammaproteobacteria bacterium]
MLRNNFESHEDAFNDLTSLLIELDTLNTAPASLSLTEAEIAEFKQVAPAAQPAMSKEESEQRSNEPEFSEVNIQDEARPAVAPHQDPLPIQGLDPEIIGDAYLELLGANKEKLKTALTYFYSDQCQISDENMSLISRTCAHYGSLGNGRFAGELLFLHINNPDKSLLSTILMDNNASVNTYVRRYHEEPRAAQEYKVTTLLRCVIDNPDKGLIESLLENGALDPDNNAMKMALASCSPEIVALFIQGYPDALPSIRDQLDQAVINSDEHPFEVIVTPMDAVKAKANLLAAMAVLEKQGHEFEYSEQDKIEFRKDLTAKIERAITLSECLKIYEDNIDAPILTYKRNLWSRLSTGYSGTKNALINQVQARIVSLLSDMVLHQPEAARDLTSQALAHDAFSPKHIGRDIKAEMTNALTRIKALNDERPELAAQYNQPQLHLAPALDNEEEEEEQKHHQPPAQGAAAAANPPAPAESRFSLFFSRLRQPNAAQPAKANEFEMQEMVSLGQAPKPADNAADEPKSPRPQ